MGLVAPRGAGSSWLPASRAPLAKTPRGAPGKESHWFVFTGVHHHLPRLVNLFA